MSVEVVLDSPLAHSLNSAIQPKLVEVGWSTGGADDSGALSEYIILMLVNGKTQDQIAAELSGDLLNLGPDDPGARDFSQWLFQQVEVLNSQLNGGDDFITADSIDAQAGNEGSGHDADMGGVNETGDSAIPTGPKSMRNGGPSRPRDKRMLGQLAKAMDRSHEAVLHRVGPQNGTGRINSHTRAPPTGPRQQVPGRGPPRTQTGRQNLGGIPTAGTAGANIMNMNPQQQLELYAMLEQQSRLMAQMLGPQGQQMGMGTGPTNGYAQQQNGRSLFDRVQNNHQKRRAPQNNFGDQQKPNSDASPSMDVDMSQEKSELGPDTLCKFNLSCTNKDCKFAHQSPAAPPGTSIDVSDTCSFGAACKNKKCTGRHPSPAQKVAHQTEMDCRFFPNCTNPRCPFKHPSMPLCRNGADCTAENCKFTHVKMMCKFNPCLNPACTFKHIDGQKRGKFEDKVWTADGANEHVSERKFVTDDGEEELIKPETAEAVHSKETPAETNVIT